MRGPKTEHLCGTHNFSVKNLKFSVSSLVALRNFNSTQCLILPKYDINHLKE